MDVVAKALDQFEDRREGVRQYIGASGVGNPCDAYLAFCLRGYPDTVVGAQLARIFREGNRLEDQMIADLRKAKFAVYDVDPKTRKQWEYTDFGRHVIGHADGQIELDERFEGAEKGEIALLELKSMNDASFRKFEKDGVKSSHPMYYGQVQLMMGLSQIKKSLFVCYNKNNSKYASELVPYDDLYYYSLKARIHIVLNNEAKKIADDETDWRCKGRPNGGKCFKFDTCWGAKKPKMFCYSCRHAKAHPHHTWHCTLHDRAAREVCGDYDLYHPKPKT